MLLSYLECYLNNEKSIHLHPIVNFPFLIGREGSLSLCVPKSSISRRHSRIDVNRGKLYIVDLKSHNGTYVNHDRIHKPTRIEHGDIIHIGDVEMRLIQPQANDHTVIDDGTMTIDIDLTNHFPFGVRELEELLAKEMLLPVYQPIVNHAGSDIVGYELLGRGASQNLPRSPEALFHIAESIGLEVELSEAMRNKGIEKATQRGFQGLIFVNTHPAELKNIDALICSLKAIKKEFSSIKLALEVHERGITNPESIRVLKRELVSLDILLAFDDFGVGQSRLLELVEATPDILKFDKTLIRGIHRADSSKLDLVKGLHRLAKKLKIKTLAECVHDQREYKVCRSLGFDYYQGYLFGRPAPFDGITKKLIKNISIEHQNSQFQHVLS